MKRSRASRVAARRWPEGMRAPRVRARTASRRPTGGARTLPCVRPMCDERFRALRLRSACSDTVPTCREMQNRPARRSRRRPADSLRGPQWGVASAVSETIPARRAQGLSRRARSLSGMLAAAARRRFVRQRASRTVRKCGERVGRLLVAGANGNRRVAPITTWLDHEEAGLGMPSTPRPFGRDHCSRRPLRCRNSVAAKPHRAARLAQQSALEAGRDQ